MTLASEPRLQNGCNRAAPAWAADIIYNLGYGVQPGGRGALQETAGSRKSGERRIEPAIGHALGSVRYAPTAQATPNCLATCLRGKRQAVGVLRAHPGPNVVALDPINGCRLGKPVHVHLCTKDKGFLRYRQGHYLFPGGVGSGSGKDGVGGGMANGWTAISHRIERHLLTRAWGHTNGLPRLPQVCASLRESNLPYYSVYCRSYCTGDNYAPRCALRAQFLPEPTLSSHENHDPLGAPNKCTQT